MNKIFKTETIDDGILKITFDLPDHSANIFTPAVAKEMNALIDQLCEDDSIRVALFVSGKPSIFIAGADVREIYKITRGDEAYQKSRLGQQLFNRWEKLPFTTIALVHGACMGGGTEFILSCDFRLASDSRKTLIGLPEVKLGVIPGWGGTQRLPRLVGLQNSLKLILTGNPVNSKQAYRMHLVDEVVPELIAEDVALRIAREIRDQGGGKYLERRKKIPLLTKIIEHTKFGSSYVFKKSREMVQKQTRGHYPAPLRALAAVEYGVEKSFSEGLEYEARQFSEMAVTDVSKNLIRIFLITEQIKKQNGVDSPDVKPQPIKKIGILGAGVMGGGIAQLAASKGYPVRLKDIDLKPLAMALKHARELFDRQVKKRRLTRREADLKMDLITTTTDYSGFGSVDLIIEAVVENPEIKKKVFQEVDQVTPDDTIIASNTSAIPITELATAVKYPEKFIGMHFFNPVHRMPLVEIIRGKKTADETVVSIYELVKKWGKTPVVVNDGPGFLVNRLLMPYMAEAVALLEEGVPIPDIDRALLDFGMPMGPFRLYDEVGIDVAFKAGKVMESFFGERIARSGILQKMVDSKRLGKKVGKGFYLFDGKKTRLDANIYQFLGVSPTKKLSAEEIQKRVIYILINEAGYVLEEQIARKPRDVDVGMIFGTGFAPFRGGPLRFADSTGIANILRDIKVFQDRVGSRYTPAPLLTKIAEKGVGFYEYFNDIVE